MLNKRIAKKYSMKNLLTIVVAFAIGGGLNAFAGNVEPIINGKQVYSANAAVIDIWADHAAESFAGGSGTQEDPYKITNAAELAKIAQDVRAGMGNLDYKNTYFSIENDIDLAGHMWLPIGVVPDDDEYARCEFSGIVDGKGHSIKNMNIDLGGLKGVGLFGFTTESFELRNLTVLTGSVKGDIDAGAFVGYNSGLVENCVNYVDVKCLQFYAGGITGLTSGTGKIYRCQNYGNVQAGYDDTMGFGAGGICGLACSDIEECVNWGTVRSKTNYAGGISGFMDGGKVSKCFNRGDIISMTETVGGIVGSVGGRTSACEISNCYNASSVEAPIYAGAIVGLVLMTNDWPFVMKNNCFDIMLYEGGLIGVLYDNFDQCVVSNNWSALTEEMTAPEFVNTMNDASDGNPCWSADVNKINDGYPVLEYMKDYVAGVSEPEKETDTFVYAVGNTITVNGVDEGTQVQVYNFEGLNIFNGNVSQLGSMYFDNGMYILTVNGKSYKVFVR